jgi:hypothetical protein
MTELAGRKVWAFAAGHIPLHSTGKEPEFTSHDKISVLNLSPEDAEVRITIFYEHHEALTHRAIKIPARRVKKIRFNDLIDPLPIPLDKPFAFLIVSDLEVIVQFSRMDTSSEQAAGFCLTPYFKPDRL